MIQTAQVPARERYLRLSEKEPAAAPGDISENTVWDPATVLADDALFQKISPFSYSDRLRFTLRLRDEYKPDFVLVRGLIEFHRPKDLVFTYDREQRSLSIDIDVTRLEQLRGLLSGTFHWVRREKQFRLLLRRALEFEARYKLERESVYQVLVNTTAGYTVHWRNM